MDFPDEASRLADCYLQDCLRRRTTVAIAPGQNGICAICGEPIPANRLATGAGTCIDCQIRIERGELA